MESELGKKEKGTKQMKFLIVGLGSMGKRRIRNLHSLNQKSIIGFDTQSKRRIEANQKYKISTFKTFNDALEDSPDVIIISTPPDQHYKYAKIAIQKKIPFFSEANVILNDVEKIQSLIKLKKIVAIPSSTLRFNPIHIKLKNILRSKKLGKPLNIIYHYGEYLPFWHPWEKVTDYYVSNKKTGGGRESVPFELVGLTYLFGDVIEVYGKIFSLSDMKVKIDDVYNFLIEFDSGVKGNVTVDVITKKPTREIKIITDKGIILADWFENTIRTFTKKQGWKKIQLSSGNIEEGYNKGEKPYIEEIRNFINKIKNKDYDFSYSFLDDLKILKVLGAIEESNKKHKRICLNYKNLEKC